MKDFIINELRKNNDVTLEIKKKRKSYDLIIYVYKYYGCFEYICRRRIYNYDTSENELDFEESYTQEEITKVNTFIEQYLIILND